MKTILFIAIFLISFIGFGQVISFDAAYQNHPNIPKGVLEIVSWTQTKINNIDDSYQQSCTGMPLPYGVMGVYENGDGYFIENGKKIATLSGISVEQQKASIHLQIQAYASAFESIYLNHQGLSEEKRIYNTLLELTFIPDSGRTNQYARDAEIYDILNSLNNTELASEHNFTPHNYNLEEVFGTANYQVLSSPKVIFEEEGIVAENGAEYMPLTLSTKSTDYGPAIWNPAASCNYGTSRNGYAITAVTVHTVQGSYAGCISWFQNCNASVSAHYVIRTSDGQITQCVRDAHRAWHVGNSNNIAIGIEHEGYVTIPSSYSTAMYQSSANLIKHFTTKYAIDKKRVAYFPWAATTNYNQAGIPGACVHIKGHQHFPAQTHTDPGQHWDWDYFYKLINNTTTPTVYTSATGNFYDSGGANGNYGNDEHKIWIIKPQDATSVTLNFSSFNVENTWDYLYIYNGEGIHSPRIGYYTGTNSPGTVTASSGKMTIEFRSECATTASGWAATWSAAVPQTDNTPPTTGISFTNDWKTEDFEVNFNDADESGGSGLWKSLYSVHSYNGTQWTANSSRGFYMDEFEGSSINSAWTSHTGTWNLSNGVLKQSNEGLGSTNISTSIQQNLSNMHLYHWQGKISGSDNNRRAGIHFFSTNSSQENGGNSYLVYFRINGNPDPNNNNKVQIYKSVGNTLEIKKNEDFTINANQWYDFKVAYDRITGYLYVWVNDQLAAHWQDPSPINNPTGGISFRSGNAVYEIDDFNVYRSRYPDVTVSVGPGNSTDVFHQNPNPSTKAGKVKSIVLDNAGNVSTISTQTFDVDWTAPTLSSVNDGSGADIDSTYSATIEANWSGNDPHSGIVDYEVAIGTTQGGTDIMGWTSVGTNTLHSFTLPNPIENQIYYYTVTAENGAGLTTTVSSDGQKYVVEDDEEEPGDETCDAPENVLVNGITSESADVSWTAGGSETSWEVVYGPTGFNPNTGGTSVVVTSTNYSITGLDAETTYDVYVRAICDNSESDWTGVETFTTDEDDTPPVDVCVPPTGITVSNITYNSADVSWTAGGSEAIWEVVYGLTGFDLNTGGTSVIVTLMNYSITGLDAGTTYDVYVRSLCDSGMSDWSAVETFTTLEDDDEEPGDDDCEAPTDLVIDNVTESSADISWQAGEGQTMWAVIYGPEGFDPQTEGDMEVVAINPSVTLVGLDAGTTYDVYVVNICDASTMTISDPLIGSFTTDEEEEDDTSSLGEHQEMSIAIYPNPASDKVFVGNLNTHAMIKVYSMNGQLVLEKEIAPEQNHFEIYGWAQGVYNLIIEVDSKVIEKMIIKK